MLSPDHKAYAYLLKELSGPGIQCDYIFIDGSLKNFRNKSQTLQKVPQSPDDIPPIEYCGSATDFDVGDVADYYSRPVHLFKDPFRRPPSFLVLCETYCREGLPTFANNRYRLKKALEAHPQSLVTSFIFEQSYSLSRKDGRSLTYLDPAYEPDSKAGFSCGRELSESHYKACLYAGISMESLEYLQDSKWRFSVDQCEAIEVCDHLWMSRFLIERVAEDFSIKSDWAHGKVALKLHLGMISSTLKIRLTDALLTKFVTKDPVQVKTRNDDIIIDGLSGDVDPYFILIRIMDVLQDIPN